MNGSVDRFTTDKNPAVAGEDLEICFDNPALAGSDVPVEISNEMAHQRRSTSLSMQVGKGV